MQHRNLLYLRLYKKIKPAYLLIKSFYLPLTIDIYFVEYNVSLVLDTYQQHCKKFSASLQIQKLGNKEFVFTTISMTNYITVPLKTVKIRICRK